jgi:hypothetical protein
MLFQYVVIVIICMLVIPAGISKLLDRQFRLLLRTGSAKISRRQFGYRR